MRLRSPFRPTRSRVPSLRRSTRSPCRSVPVLLLALALCSHLRFRSLTEGLKRRPGPSEELDEELDVIQTNRLNDRGHGAQEEYDEVKHEGCEESNENQEDKGHHIPGIECWENHGLEHDDVERERHGRLRDADRREARIGDDVRQETEEFHDVEWTLRREEKPHATEEHADGGPGDRIVRTEPDLGVDVSLPREPAEELVPDQVSKRRAALRVHGPPRRSNDHDDEEARQDEQPSDLAERVLPAVAEIVDESDDEPDRQVDVRGEDGEDDEVRDLLELLERRVERDVDPEDRGPVEELDPGGRDRRMVERDPECLPEEEDAEQEGPESTPYERDEEVLPEVPRAVLPPSKQPDSVDHPHEPVAGVAYHEAEEDREREGQDKRRIDLAVVRRGEELHEHLERSEGLRIPEQDGRIRLCGRRFHGFGAMILPELRDEQPGEASELALKFLEGFRRDPAFDDERVIRHGESERRFRLLDRHFEASLRGGEKAGVPLSQGLQPLFDGLEACLPAFSLGEQVREDLPRIAVALRDGNAREAVLRQEVAHGRGLRFRDEHGEEPRCGERLVIRRHGVEVLDFARDLPDEHLKRVVSAVIHQGQGKLCEGPDLVDLAVQVLEERLGLLFRGIFLRDVEFEREDLLAEVTRDLVRRRGRRLLELKHRRDRSELHEDLGRLRGGRKGSADFETFLALAMVDDVHELETVQALDGCFEVFARPDDQGPRHRDGPRHSGHP